jgi:hypothetical protein
MSRTDPFDDRSAPDAPRRGAVFGLNDLNVENEPGFGVTESNTTEGTESGIENIDDQTTSLESEPSAEDTEETEEARNASDDVFGGAAEMNDS